MRKWTQAHLVCGASAVAFAAAWWLDARLGTMWTQGLYYTTQAALIGSLADWFAVTALFVRPLGIRWHTALIPRQREAVVDGIRRWVEERLLGPSLWRDAVAEADLVTRCRQWWREPAHRRSVETRIGEWAAAAVTQLTTAETVAVLAGEIRRLLGAQLTAPQAESLWQERQGPLRTVRLLADALQRWTRTDAARKIVRERLAATVRGKADSSWAEWGLRLAEWSGLVSYEEWAEEVLVAVRAQAAAWSDETHPSAQAAADALSRAAARAAADPVVQDRWEREIGALLAACPLEAWLTAECGRRLADGARLKTAAARRAGELIDAWLADDARRAVLNRKLAELAAQHGSELQQWLGAVIAEVLVAYDEQRLNAFIFTKVEDELAAVRMNGALVGAVIGAVIWGLMYGVYAPLAG